jgi:hypothetical protein
MHRRRGWRERGRGKEKRSEKEKHTAKMNTTK